ncbi:IucA/IucC family protein [Microbulbifer sediminum]|uniref:IucA/IucC family protein n=1 Tax=Microbulbifer sediminum TaxID=2904250 RepID=UPI001F1B4C75|nr:IucA/IucC family protein [Microbulbifer sediminum]
MPEVMRGSRQQREEGVAGTGSPEAERLSANSFFNALLRESGAGRWYSGEDIEVPDPVSVPAVAIDLKESNARLWIGVRYRSLAGRHQFELPLLLERGCKRCEALSLAEVAVLVAREKKFFPEAAPDSRQEFVERTSASVRNMALALDARQGDLARIFLAPLDFADAEQALLSGHAMHPTPKSREPMTDEEAGLYAPEFGGDFPLQWLAVDPGLLGGKSGTSEPAEKLAYRLWREEGNGQSLPDGYIPFPAHPWQWHNLRRDARVGALLDSGGLVVLGHGGRPWRATSSLRAVYGEHSPFMLKFSLSLRLTNSLRTLLPKEMARGLEVPRVRSTPVGREFAARYPAFTVLAEPAYLLLRDVQGEPISESLVLFRENPFLGAGARNACVLATLTQDHPGQGHCRAAQMIQRRALALGLSRAEATREWFGRFLDVVIEPLMIAQADYGLLYGAHQQNLIIAFADDLPRAGFFRDCQGTAYSPLGKALLHPYLPGLATDSENLLDETMANRLFVYYLVVNSCFGLIGALGAAGLLQEAALLEQLRGRLQELARGPRRDPTCLDYLLTAGQLWAKGNFRCAMRGMNETTTDNPLAIYHQMDNPLLEPASTAGSTGTSTSQ